MQPSPWTWPRDAGRLEQLGASGSLRVLNLGYSSSLLLGQSFRLSIGLREVLVLCPYPNTSCLRHTPQVVQGGFELVHLSRTSVCFNDSSMQHCLDFILGLNYRWICPLEMPPAASGTSGKSGNVQRCFFIGSRAGWLY